MNVRLGTRTSPLAMAQARIVQKKLEDVFPNLEVECIKIETAGDKDLTSPLHLIGGKGIFIKEIEQALLDEKIDIAVHSLKDITSDTPDGLFLKAFLEAEFFLDVLVLKPSFHHFNDLLQGATLATGSLRRKALLKRMRPDIKTVEIRGNVNTRLKKLDRGDFDGVVFSEAGLIRLGMEDRVTYRFDPHTFYPAPGQGVIALETRTNDQNAHKFCDAINHSQQYLRSTMEMGFLKVLGLDCNAPIGAFTFFENKVIHLKAFISDQTMTHFLEDEVIATPEERLNKAQELGEKFLHWLKHVRRKMM